MDPEAVEAGVLGSVVRQDLQLHVVVRDSRPGRQFEGLQRRRLLLHLELKGPQDVAVRRVLVMQSHDSEDTRSGGGVVRRQQTWVRVFVREAQRFNPSRQSDQEEPLVPLKGPAGAGSRGSLDHGSG